MYLGIDLGGTKIEAVVLADSDTVGEKILFRQRVETPSQDYSATLSAIISLITQAEQAVGVFSQIGIGTPGAVSRKTGAMKNCNSTCLNGEYLVEDLQRLSGKTVFQANDANCFALSEATDGAGKGTAVVFGVILGTGVGGGIVIDGRVIQGVNHIAGEWGHNPLPHRVIPEGELRSCYCGKVNCIETFLSGPGFARTFHNMFPTLNGQNDKEQDSSALLTAKAIAELIDQRDPQALAALDHYSRQLAAALSGVINVLDPDVIVLGGGMSNIDQLYSGVFDYLADFVFSDSLETRIVPPVYGDSSGVRGAAWLTRQG